MAAARRNVSLLCGIALHELYRVVIRPQFGAPERPCRCECHDRAQAV